MVLQTWLLLAEGDCSLAQDVVVFPRAQIEVTVALLGDVQEVLRLVKVGRAHTRCHLLLTAVHARLMILLLLLLQKVLVLHLGGEVHFLLVDLPLNQIDGRLRDTSLQSLLLTLQIHRAVQVLHVEAGHDLGGGPILGMHYVV